VLGADVLIAQAPGLILGPFERLAQPRTDDQPLRGRARHLGQAVEFGPQTAAQRRRVRAGPGEHLGHDPALLLDERQQEMFRLHLRVLIPAHQLLRAEDCLLRLLGELIESNCHLNPVSL
jgi:hypothetical protein